MIQEAPGLRRAPGVIGGPPTGSTAFENVTAPSKFPTALVYGAPSRSELRLVTCGGSFDQRTGHYVDNVAFAHLI